MSELLTLFPLPLMILAAAAAIAALVIAFKVVRFILSFVGGMFESIFHHGIL